MQSMSAAWLYPVVPIAGALPAWRLPMDGVAGMPWWAPQGGIVECFAVICGLGFVNKVGGGASTGLSIAANILMSHAIDKFGGSGMEHHALKIWRVRGAVLMVGGVALIAAFS